MTRKEKIIEILHNHSIEINADIEKWLWSGEFEAVADEILALPLDVPSDDEVKKHMIEMNLYQHLDEFDNDVWDEGKLHWAIQGYKIAAKWMRDEIIKRNNILE